MTAAEELRRELANSDIIDKKKVMAAVENGIRNVGECLVLKPYGATPEIIYGTESIKVGTLAAETAIKQFVLSQGFRIRRAFHPVSGREYGFYVTL